MHEDVGNSRIGPSDSVLHLVRDGVAFAHRDGAIDSDVQIDVERNAHFPDETFLHFQHAGDCRGGLLDYRDDFAARESRIERLEAEMPKALEEYERAKH